MRCEQFDERLQQLLDARLQPSFDHELLSHAGDCAACHQMLEGARLLADYSLQTPPYPQAIAGCETRSHSNADFAQQVVSQFLKESSSSPTNKDRDASRSSNDRTLAAVSAFVLPAKGEKSGQVIEPRQVADGKQALEVARGWHARSMTYRRRLQGAVLSTLTAAVVLVLASPLFLRWLEPTAHDRGPVADSRIHYSDSISRESGDSHENNASGEQASSSSSRNARFLGPAPFSTGGNFAVAISMMPDSIERIGLGAFDTTSDEIDRHVMPITNSLNMFVNAIWESLPAIRSAPKSALPPSALLWDDQLLGSIV